MRARVKGLVKRGLLAAGHYRRRLERDRFPGVAVLCYHGVVPDSARAEHLPFRDLHVRPSELESHCRLLRDVCHPIHIRDWLAADEGTSVLPARPVLVTFDDGYESIFTLAKPILEKYRIPALLFVATGAVRSRELFWHDRAAIHFGEPGVEEAKSLPFPCWQSWERSAEATDIPDLRALTLEEIRSLAGHDLFAFGGHTVSHLILSKADGPTQQREIAENRDELRRWTANDVSVFAYPNGRPGIDYTQETVRLVQEQEYRMAFSTRPAFATGSDSRWERPRFLMLSGISEAELAHRLAISWR